MNERPMGIGSIGTSEIRFIRKWRWTFSASSEYDGQTIETQEAFVGISGRPTPCGTITCTYFDIGNNNDLTPMFSIASHAYKAFDNEKQHPINGTLKLYDGCGVLMESWDMELFMTAVNFAELDHSSTSTVDLEITYRVGQFKYHDHTAGWLPPVTFGNAQPNTSPSAPAETSLRAPTVCREQSLPDPA